MRRPFGGAGVAEGGERPLLHDGVRGQVLRAEQQRRDAAGALQAGARGVSVVQAGLPLAAEKPEVWPPIPAAFDERSDGNAC